MTAEEWGLLADVIENRDDDAPRLIYADWLEDHGRGDRADFIRRQIRGEMAGEVGNIPWPDSLSSLLGTTPDIWGDRGWKAGWSRGFIDWVCCPLAEWWAHGPDVAGRHPLVNAMMSDRKPVQWTQHVTNVHEYRWHFDDNAEQIASPYFIPEAFSADPLGRIGGRFGSPDAAHAALGRVAILWARRVHDKRRGRPA